MTLVGPELKPGHQAPAFGHVDFGVTASLAIGSVPAVFVGSLFSSMAPDRYVRPVITFVIAASGLKYVGIDATTLGWLLCAALLVIAAAWLFVKRPWSRPSPAPGPGLLSATVKDLVSSTLRLFTIGMVIALVASPGARVTSVETAV